LITDKKVTHEKDDVLVQKRERRGKGINRRILKKREIYANYIMNVVSW